MQKLHEKEYCVLMNFNEQMLSEHRLAILDVLAEITG